MVELYDLDPQGLYKGLYLSSKVYLLPIRTYLLAELINHRVLFVYRTYRAYTILTYQEIFVYWYYSV